MRKTEADWLLNLACRTIEEALEGVEPETRKIAILIAIPEKFREHPSASEITESEYIEKIETKIGRRFHEVSCVLDGGAASVLNGMKYGRKLLLEGTVRMVLLGGVDSYVNNKDFDRLQNAGRFKAEDNSQGMTPGEGAAFVLLATTPGTHKSNVSGMIRGIGFSEEKNTAASESYSVGEGMLGALMEALRDGQLSEAEVSFIVSNSNGERYQAWEAMIFRPRFYRTQRSFLPILHPAMSVGDLGAASAALTLLVAANLITKGFALGSAAIRQVAMCEIASEGAGRGACIVESLPHQVK
jgi:3-oxoacyl-[acyl-carrier-protein] synthase-1